MRIKPGIGAGRWALVLAGGDGKRLQQLTQSIAGAPIPKQYCRLLGDRSLLEATLARAQRFAARDRTTVIINQNHLDVGWPQVEMLPSENVIIQPHNRDTGPGILFALLDLAARDPDGIVAVFPSDHYIGDDAAFIAHVHQASELVQDLPERVVILGIEPERPDPGFGYIMPGARLGATAGVPVFDVLQFHEKPSHESAALLLAQGGLWNSFVMVFRVGRMLQLLRALMPAEVRRMRAARSGGDHRYAALAPWNFSSQLLARIPQHLAVLRVEGVHWNDWGTPESILRSVDALERLPSWLTRLQAHRGPSGSAARRVA
jgi:mannose-1-phosphate guanylyltransferase